ncbi:MerR family transcriptional regulator [Algiphilus sp.]|uniref:MerR family transcriptional regulator n=1 Tax=Algiphilus sp. TaxID=1872431 RepID=UPI001CA799EA|nr:MerR family transcriptional regulator [Algiphilus sp.]MBY8964174.1 MerR family transcriptional regulator [Algiphilus acroporae]MCI5062732.1 MerR family transcriptional regulator [Algiphilus sp.]MCI5104688.1 MerR family transcriptional regulator [Algiphilus sp.]
MSSHKAADAETDPVSTHVVEREYTIDELARAADTTVRNVRAYQDRGLIPPPERRGRTGYYGSEHLSRLRIIGQMINRGYTLTSIGELLEAWEHGRDIAQVMGLEAAVTSPWTDETGGYFTLPQLVKMFGGKFEPRWLVKASELGILRSEGARFYAPSPRMLRAGAELVKTGIPLDEMLDVVAKLRDNVERAANDMVRLVEHHIFDRFGPGLPPSDEIPALGDAIWRLRPLVEVAVHAEVARAMERAATRHLGDRLAYVLDHLHDHAETESAAPPPADKGPGRKRASSKTASRKKAAAKKRSAAAPAGAARKASAKGRNGR